MDSGNYAGVLEELGLSYTVRGPWAVVGRTDRIQGWKLHLSSVPGPEAEQLLQTVIPVLQARGASFKVARDAGVLAHLNEGAFGATQVGKFITVYPGDDAQARALAVELAERTRGHKGPRVPTDLRLGDVVYARYGGFNPVPVRDRLGQVTLQIQTPDGGWQPDRYEVPFVPPAGIANPFEGLAYPSGDGNGDDGGRLHRMLGPGYLVVSVLKEHAEGAVFLAVDVRSQETVAGKVVKQGRQYCLWDEHGRDMRTRLRRQGDLHARLAAVGLPVPGADPYFEQDGDGYLPLEYVEGVTIESRVASALAGSSWRSLNPDEQIRMLAYLDQTAVVLERLHSLGYVHRDVSASNVWIGADGKVYLLDLELAHAVDDPEPAFGLGTPGFMSPQQEARQAPAFADDVFALGCVGILVLTGLDPRRVLKRHDAHLAERLTGLAEGAPRPLVEVVAQCVRDDPAERPGLADFRRAVQEAVREIESGQAIRLHGAGPGTGVHFDPQGRGDAQRSRPAVRFAMPEGRDGRRRGETGIRNPNGVLTETALQQLVAAGARGLLEATVLDPSTGLWLSPPLNGPRGVPLSSHAGDFELRRSAHRGVAGVVYTLARLSRWGYHLPEFVEAVRRAADWLRSGQPAPDSGLPGLYFGDAGVAVALAEAAAARLIEADPALRRFIAAALQGKLDWPDVTHGAAGQGIAALLCADLLQEESWLGLAHRCAHYLLEHQREDGSWVMPAGVNGMSGQTLTGFAHGVAGMVYFLLEYAHQFQDERAEEAARRGARWLADQAEEVKGGQALQWRYSDAVADRWRWWCHGSPGIALTYLRLYERTGEAAWADLARKALRVHPEDVRAGNLSQCHGLSGLGEIYLEAHRVLGEPEWRARADHIAATLYHLRRTTETGAVAWLVEEPRVPTADLMMGCGGVVHFLSRHVHAHGTAGFPMLFGPADLSGGASGGAGRRPDRRNTLGQLQLHRPVTASPATGAARG